MIHLDTGFLIRALLRDTPEDRALHRWLRSDEQLAISAVGWAEFLCGPVPAPAAELAARIVRQRVPFDEEDAGLAARLFNLAGRRRGSLMDCMIAATAIRAGAPLATSNPSDFRPFNASGLRIVGT